MQSRFTWTGVAAAALGSAATPWWAWASLVVAALAAAVTGKVLDYLLRRRAIEKVSAQRVVDVLNAAPAVRRGSRTR